MGSESTIRQLPTVEFAGLRLRPTCPLDVDFVIRAEQDSSNSLFIKQWTRQEHLDSLKDPNFGHWLIELVKDNLLLGYIIANGFENTNGKIFLKRIVVTHKNQGYGRRALRAFQQMVFSQPEVNLIWLCVYPQNKPARYLYRSEGYAEIGLSPQEKLIMMALERKRSRFKRDLQAL